MTRNWFESLFLSVKAQVVWGVIALVLSVVMYVQSNFFWIAYFTFLSAWSFRGAWTEYWQGRE